jgi:hypothetical protein
MNLASLASDRLIRGFFNCYNDTKPDNRPDFVLSMISVRWPQNFQETRGFFYFPEA